MTSAAREPGLTRGGRTGRNSLTGCTWLKRPNKETTLPYSPIDLAEKTGLKSALLQALVRSNLAIF